MKQPDRVIIQHECEQLILRYAHLNDLGDWQGLAGTFTEDASFSRRPRQKTSFRDGATFLKVS